MDQTDVAEHRPDRLEVIEAEQAKLTETVLSLAAKLSRLTGGPAAGPPLEPLVDPGTGEVLAGDAVAAGSGELVAWVSWLTGHYELGATLPACWPRHGALVEELEALRVGWRDTIGAGKGGTAALQWHDYLGHVLDRIERRWRVCIDGTHRAGEPADWLAGGPDGADELDLAGGRFSPG